MSNKKNKKVLAIGIDGVIRDLFTQFDTWYRKTYIKNDSLVQMDNEFRYVEGPEETEEEQRDLQRQIDEKITFPLDSFDLLNHYQFESREDFEKFFYTDFSFQIFASANAYPKSMDSVNFLQLFGDKNELYDVVLFSKCKDSSIVSTYHFLAKYACKIRNVKFVEEYEDIWSIADVVISDCPEVFETKIDESKTAIKINHLYNEYSESDYSFDTVNEIVNEKFLNKIFS
jgi:hypothetical protein